MSFCIYLSPAEVLYLDVQSHIQKNCTVLLAEFKQDQHTLALQTPTCRVVIKSSSCPFKIYEALILENKPEFPLPPPPFHLITKKKKYLKIHQYLP
jgi:hypothetical protein